MEEEKKKGVVEKSGEGLGKVANKGVGVVKGFGKGLRNIRKKPSCGMRLDTFGPNYLST